ncbi:hypothetical protein BDY24DRAFT_383179 [Mrakia frigida]|uniref:uncharacterized protein n=1 Tax=Mrakia frigida TaxID=29902 RepID=UPI003FCC004A
MSSEPFSSSSVLALRGLIGVSKTSMGQVGSVVDVALLSLSVLGALGILGGLAWREWKTGASTVRTRLLSFLVFGDLVMGIVGVISPSYYLATGRGPPSKVCTFTAFMLLSSFWTQYLSAIFLAVSTYLILLHPLSSATRHLQRYWALLFPITWAISFIAAGVAWRVTGFAFRGGFCYYDSTRGPEYFGDIYSLAPRAVVLVIVVALYTHLFLFLRRPDRISSPNTSQVDEIRIRSTTSASNEANFKWWTRKRTLGVVIPGEDLPSPLQRPVSTFVRGDSDRIPMQVRGGGGGVDEKFAPWERLDLEVPTLNSASELVPLSNGRRVSIAPFPSGSPLGGSRRGSAAPFYPPPPTVYTTAASPNTNHTPDGYFPSSKPTTTTIPSPPLSPSSLAPSSQTVSSRTPLAQAPTPHTKAESESTTLSEGNPHEDEDDDSTESEVDSLSPPSRTKAGGGGRNGLSLKEILDSTGPSSPSGPWLGIGGNRVMDSGGGSSWGAKMEAEGKDGSGSAGWDNQESMNAYLNRKASMLMILFPLAYIALFSVSLVRIICDFTVHAPIPVLSAVARWLIFSQGIVDFTIYGVVEWKVKRDVRRKTSQGHFASPRPVRSTGGSYSNPTPHQRPDV